MHAWPAVGALALLVSACVYPATEVIVQVDTDLDLATHSVTTIRAAVRGGDASSLFSVADADIERCLTFAPAPGDGGGHADGGIDAILADSSVIDARGVDMGAARDAPCIAVTTMTRVDGGHTIGTFAVVPPATGSRDRSFDVAVELVTAGVTLRRRAHGQLLVQHPQTLAVMLRQACDAVMTSALCGSVPCTFEEFCNAAGTRCDTQSGHARCVSMGSDGVCAPGENNCNEPACPSRLGDGCCSGDENNCTAPLDNCPAANDNGCCDPGESSCANPRDQCPRRPADGCCDPGETACANPDDNCMPRIGDGCCSGNENRCVAPDDNCPGATGNGCCDPGETPCSNPADNCMGRLGDGCCTGSENRCTAPADNCPAAQNNNCCDPGETICNQPNDACAVRNGDNCCSPGDDLCAEPACMHCGNHVCDCGESYGLCPADCGCDIRCCDNAVHEVYAPDSAGCYAARITVCAGVGTQRIRFPGPSATPLFDRSPPCI